jgi:hypothetical protein
LGDATEDALIQVKIFSGIVYPHLGGPGKF